MEKIKTLAVGILLALIAIFFVNALSPISRGEVMDATFISKNDRKVRLKFTKETDKERREYRDSGGEILFDWEEESLPIVYLQVGKNKYKGTYQKSSKGFKTYISLNITDKEFEVHKPANEFDTSILVMYKQEGNKLKLVDGWGDQSIFSDNKSFYRKTWWRTWGIKLCIILIVAFIIWLLRIPEFIKNKKYREAAINDFKESKKEYDKEKEEMLKDYYEEVSGYKELMKEGVNEMKEGVNEIKDILKKGFEEYKNNNKKD